MNHWSIVNDGYWWSMKVFHNTKIGNSEATVLVEEMVWYYTYVYNYIYLYTYIYIYNSVCVYICIYEYIYIYIIQEAEAWIKVKWQKQNNTPKLDEITEISTGFCWIHSTAKGIDPFSVPKTGRTFSQGWNMIQNNVVSNIFQYISNIFLRLEMPSQNQASDFWRKFAPILFKPAPWVRDHVQGWSWWSDLQLR